MTSEEQARLASLPEIVTIYRGQKTSRCNGFSWALDREKAVWFAYRFCKKRAYLLTSIAPKDRILALFDGRSEDEVIVLKPFKPAATKLPPKKATGILEQVTL